MERIDIGSAISDHFMKLEDFMYKPSALHYKTYDELVQGDMWNSDLILEEDLNAGYNG